MEMRTGKVQTSTQRNIFVTLPFKARLQVLKLGILCTFGQTIDVSVLRCYLLVSGYPHSLDTPPRLRAIKYVGL